MKLSQLVNAYTCLLFQWAIMTSKLGQSDLVLVCISVH